MSESLVKIARYGGLFEVTRFQKPLIAGGFKRSFIHRKRNKSTFKSTQNIWRTKRRIKRHISIAVHTEGPPSFATFTYATPQHDMQQAIQHWRDFTRKVKKFLPAVAFLRVPERHKSGAVHFHAVLFGVPPELPCIMLKRGRYWRHGCSKERSCERKVRLLYGLWKHGFVDISVVRQPDSIGVYLAKYLTKGDPDWSLFGHHVASTNLRMRQVISNARKQGTYFEMSSYRHSVAVSMVLDDYAPVITIRKVNTFKTHWLGDAQYSMYTVKPPPPLSPGG